jgi:hypothetical protein
MRLVLAVLTLSVLAIPATAGADRRSERRAESHLNAALRAAEDGSRDCRRLVLRDLRDILDEMSRRMTARTLERIERDVRDLERAAGRECSRAVRRNLEDSRRHLKDAAAAAERRERDRDRDRREPPRPRIDCWNQADEACYSTRDGQYPVQRVAFHRLLQTFEKTSSNISKGDLMKQVAKTNYFTTLQLVAILRTSSSDITKGDMVKDAAAKVVDPGNAFVLRNTTRSSITADDMVRYVTEAARNFRQ